MRVVLLLSLAAFLGCSRPTPASTEPPPDPSAEPSHAVSKRTARANPTTEAVDRKVRSEARLGAEGVKVGSWLPVIETEGEAKPRGRDEVVDRAFALMIVAVKGGGMDEPEVERATARFGAASFFSPKEKAFVFDGHPPDAERLQFAWRYEGLAVLEWALGFERELGRPAEPVDPTRLVARMIEGDGPKVFRERARLRSVKELLDEDDLIFRYDWACVDARGRGGPAPSGVSCDVVVERHRALNWLVGYESQAWDDVSTDT